MTAPELFFTCNLLGSQYISYNGVLAHGNLKVALISSMNTDSYIHFLMAKNSVGIIFLPEKKNKGKQHFMNECFMFSYPRNYNIQYIYIRTAT